MNPVCEICGAQLLHSGHVCTGTVMTFGGKPAGYPSANEALDYEDKLQSAEKECERLRDALWTAYQECLEDEDPFSTIAIVLDMDGK